MYLIKREDETLEQAIAAHDKQFYATVYDALEAAADGIDPCKFQVINRETREVEWDGQLVARYGRDGMIGYVAEEFYDA